MIARIVTKASSTNSHKTCFALTTNFRMAEPHDGAYNLVGGEPGPPPRLCQQYCFRLRARGRQAIFLFENNQRTIPSVMRPTRPFPPMSLTQPMMFAVTAPKNGRFA